MGRPPPRPTLFPYTTLFRSGETLRRMARAEAKAGGSREAGIRAARDEFYRSEEHTSELQSHSDLVCRLLLEKKKKKKTQTSQVQQEEQQQGTVSTMPPRHM